MEEMEIAHSEGAEAPVADWVDLDEMHLDPYPTYARLRELGPVVFVPAFEQHALTSHAAVMQAERRAELFSAHVAMPTEYFVGGSRSMLNKDDPDHATERRAINSTLRPQAMETTWNELFRRNAEHWLDHLESVGPDEADLVRDFSLPLAAQNIRDLVGLPSEISVADVARWSTAFVAGDLPATNAEINTHLDEVLPRKVRSPDQSVTSHLLQAGIPEETVRADVCLTIAGGVNEPQHMISAMTWALSASPGQLRAVQAQPDLWGAAFEEAVRCFSPLGALERVTTTDLTWHGVSLPKGSTVTLLIGGANHDETVFPNPAVFDLRRSTRGHLGFGAGVHQCAGRWAAKSSISQVAVPALFNRFPGLRIDQRRESLWEGWAFRGLARFAVTW